MTTPEQAAAEEYATKRGFIKFDRETYVNWEREDCIEHFLTGVAWAREQDTARIVYLTNSLGEKNAAIAELEAELANCKAARAIERSKWQELEAEHTELKFRIEGLEK